MATVPDLRRPGTRLQVVGVALLVLLVGVLVSWAAVPRLAPTGDQLATPGNEVAEEHTWGATGCSMPGASIDSVPGLFDFRHACIHHGGCYEGLDRHGGTAVIDRLRCDQLFRADLEASCTYLHGRATDWRATECGHAARSYYEIVRAFGAPYYEGSGEPA